jgi:ribonuclease P protein component
MMQTFTKDERLRKKILIDQLFRKGNSFHVFPFRVSWLPAAVPGNSPVQVLIAVPKLHIRKAADRNKIKRRIREAYRKNKVSLYDFLLPDKASMVLGLTYTSKEILSYQLLQEKIIVLLQRLMKEYAKDAG